MTETTDQIATIAGVELTETSINFSAELDYDDWIQFVEQLVRVEASVQWWIGDMLVYGEQLYGERYTQAMNLTGKAPGTVANWEWVCSRIPRSRRRSDVPFTLHYEVAGLAPEDQAAWLQAAAEEGWSKTDLRRALRDNPSADSPPRPKPLQPAPSASGSGETGPIEIVPEDGLRIAWSISVSVPETANLIGVQEAIEQSASALKVKLDQIQADPDVFVAVDV